MSDTELARALEVIRALLRVLDAQTARLVWDEDTRDAYQRARTFLREASG